MRSGRGCGSDALADRCACADVDSYALAGRLASTLLYQYLVGSLLVVEMDVTCHLPLSEPARPALSCGWQRAGVSDMSSLFGKPAWPAAARAGRGHWHWHARI